MFQTAEVITDIYKNYSIIATAYIDWFVRLDNLEKEIRQINSKKEIFLEGENKFINMDDELTLQILLLYNITSLKQICVNELTMYLYTYIVTDNTSIFYEKLEKILNKNKLKQHDQITEIEEVEDQKGGGAIMLSSILYAVMTMVLVKGLYNSNNDIKGLQPRGNVNLEMSTIINKPGKLAKSMTFESKFNKKDINLDDEEELEQFVNLFKPPTDSAPVPFQNTSTFQSPNITKTFGDGLDVDPTAVSGALTLIGFAILANNPDALNKYMKKTIPSLNKMSKNVMNSLKDVCSETLTKLTTADLPKEYFRIFNDKMKEKTDIMEEQLETEQKTIEEEQTALVLEEMLLDEGLKTPAAPTAYEYAVEWVYGKQKDQNLINVNVSEYEKFQDEVQQRVSENVEKEMDIRAEDLLNKTITDVFIDMQADISEQQLQNNREALFERVCEFDPLEFKYEEGILSITDNARPLQYLSVLTSNINLFGETALSKMNPDDVQYNQVKSLVQKSKVIKNEIIPLLNINLKKAVLNKKDAGSVEEFTSNLLESLTDIQKANDKATKSFPGDEEKQQIFLQQQRDLMENEIRKNRELQDIENKNFQADQNISNEQWANINQFTNDLMDGAFKVSGDFGQSILNATESGGKSILNMTGNLAVDFGDTLKEVVDAGLGPLINSLFEKGMPIVYAVCAALIIYLSIPYLRAVSMLKAANINRQARGINNQPGQIEDSPPNNTQVQRNQKYNIDIPGLAPGWRITIDEQGQPIVRPPEPPGPPPEQKDNRPPLPPGPPPTNRTEGGKKRRTYKGRRKSKKTQKRKGKSKKRRKTKNKRKRKTIRRNK